ncbi:MAG: hypothetical protein AAFW64_09555, partial [Pseudomonadota bacterium]
VTRPKVDALERGELISLLVLLLNAGHEATVHSIIGAMSFARAVENGATTSRRNRRWAAPSRSRSEKASVL